MKDFGVSVRKLTDVNLMREACEMTFLGKSQQSLLSIYKTEHSPVRTQLFWVKLTQIPLYVSTHLIRHHVGSVPFQLSCRTDRNGGNPGLIAKLDEVINSLNCLAGQPEEYVKPIIQSVVAELEWLQENSDRYTPVNLGVLINAQSLIDMSKLRLCNQASPETRQVFSAIKDEIAKVDPELAAMMVRKCVYRGGLCGESRCCGYNCTAPFKKELANYLSNFSEKQIGNLQVTIKD